MADAPITLGRRISESRRRRSWSQRQLAERILREDGTPISPQYLNDIERNRRVPPEYLLRQFSRILGLDADHLTFLAGRIPAFLSKRLADEQTFVAFRREKPIAPQRQAREA